MLTPDISPDLTYNLLVSAAHDAQQNLWLTTWRLTDDGTFVQLDKRGYGSNADVDVRAYALAHRPLLRQNRSVEMFQVVTPIHTADDKMRLISWSVNPTTGAINGLQDSGDWGNPASDTTVDAATFAAGAGQTGPYYVVSYRDGEGRLATNSWEVNEAGMPFARGFGESGVNIRGTSPNETYVGDQAIAPLTATGFVSAHTNNSQSRVTWWKTGRSPVVVWAVSTRRTI